MTAPTEGGGLTDFRVAEFGEQPSNFIQWKGTEVCIDLICSCGRQGHFDGYFLYAWKCAACGTVWEMAWSVGMRENPDFDGPCQEVVYDDEEVEP